jgi:drug/metabolite transporter (DMT)-like permease
MVMTRISGQNSVFLAILGFGVLAGAAFIFVKVLVSEQTPLQVVASRKMAGSIAVVGVMLLTRTGMPMSAVFVRGVLVLGVLDGVAPYLLVAHAQVHVTSGTAAILVSTMPLFTTLFAWWSLRDQSLGPATVAGIAAGFAGVIILAGPDALDVRGNDTAATGALLLAAASYAAATVYARGLLKIATPLALTGAKLTIAAAIVAPLALVIDGTANFGALSTEGWASLVTLGFGSTGLGRAVYVWAIGKAGSVKASLVTYIAPVAAIALSWSLLGEAVDARMLAGAAMIVAGVAAVMFGRQMDAMIRRVFEGRSRQWVNLNARSAE